MAIKYAPLPSSTLLISIFGFFISAIYVLRRWPDFGFAFMLVFAIMFIGSFISMTFAKSDDLLLMEEYEQTHEGAIFKESEQEKEVEHFLGLDKKKTKKKRR